MVQQLPGGIRLLQHLDLFLAATQLSLQALLLTVLQLLQSQVHNHLVVAPAVRRHQRLQSLTFQAQLHM